MNNTLSKTVTLSMLTASFLYATNGDHLIGIGGKARGMAGAGIALSQGAESGLSNPALITAVKETEISFGGTLFMPRIFSKLGNAKYTHSSADISMIPEVSIAHALNDNWYIGVGMWGTAGMGTDYRDVPQLFGMVTNLQLLQFGIPLAYKKNGLSVAVTPILQYGNLDINYNFGQNIGAGIAQDFAAGYNLGMTYNFEALGLKAWSLGMNYKSSIEMNYDQQLTTATQPFGIVLAHGDTLEQPEEFGIGVSYVREKHRVALDYKKIQWADAKGYGDFGWQNQNVYAIGYEYSPSKQLSFRTGFNYGSATVIEGNNPSLNFFNLLGFPATVQRHYTVGATYHVSQNYSIDIAYVYAGEEEKTFSIAGLPLPATDITTKHSQKSLSFQLNYTF